MAVTEEVVAAVTEADEEEEEVEVVVLEPRLELAVLRQRGPRRRTSWTWQSTWTRPSSSSSTAVEKVNASNPDKATRDHNKQTNAETKQNTVRGTLKGYDALMNLVLDEVEETLRGKLLVFSPRPPQLSPSSSKKSGPVINHKGN